MTDRGLERQTHLRLAGALFFIAGAGILMAIITAESLYPAHYTTGGSMISDLGGTEPPHSIVYQPSAGIFDIAMMVTGVLVLVGAADLFLACRRRSVSIPIALFGIGVLGVGLFPGDSGTIHAVFAMVTFAFGGVSAILSYRILSGPLRYIAIVLGAVTLVNLVAYLVLGDSWFVAGLGVGGLERWVAYPAMLWLMGFGGYLMAAPVVASRRSR